ncbi:MAG: hypothetical protein WBD28_12445 [Candidatus Zixiibacteriota bacterium]
MPSDKKSSDDKTSAKINASDILKDYQTLSQEYFRILDISKEILNELEKEANEVKLSQLLDRKLEIGKRIELLSQRIANQDIGSLSSDKSILNEVKMELEKIKSLANKLWDLEREIKKVL